jgi:hypothetical protein
MRFTTIAAIVVCAVNASVVAGAEAKAKAKAKANNGAASAVTVSGCLERDDDVFRLTETGGAQAPKERNWKTGFVRKRNSDLQIVDASKRLKLKDHVGHRVSVTGSVADREMRASSMRHLAASCGH